jgi:phage baseplate assembly protein V
MISRIVPVWVEIEGVPLAAGLSELHIQQRLGFPALCEVSFSSLSDLTPLIQINQKLRVAFEDSGEWLFNGEVTAVEYLYPAGRPPALRVRGYDRLHRLRKRQHVRAYSQISLERLLQELAGEDTKTELCGEDLSWGLLIQHQQTDLEFLAEQAAQAGMYPLACEENICLVPLSGLPGLADFPLVYGDNLFEAQIELNSTSGSDTVSVGGWKSSDSSMYSARSGVDDDGEMIENPALVKMDEHHTGYSLINQSLESKRHAQALANAEKERHKAGCRVLRGRAAGSHKLQPGTPVRLIGLAEDLAQRYILTSVTHTFDRVHGYVAELSSEPPPAPPRSRCDVITSGVVSRVDDPQQMGRVRARLPGYEVQGEIETDWMPVVCPGAGHGKGLVTLPDPGDRVLIILAREDPAHGIVLGGLFAPEHPPGNGIAHGRASSYTWTTRDGQTIRLDQDGRLVLIENGAGAGIELEGNKITIRAGRIDFYHR